MATMTAKREGDPGRGELEVRPAHREWRLRVSRWGRVRGRLSCVPAPRARRG